jgi:hypothetical protein
MPTRTRLVRLLHIALLMKVHSRSYRWLSQVHKDEYEEKKAFSVSIFHGDAGEILPKTRTWTRNKVMTRVVSIQYIHFGTRMPAFVADTYLL